MLTGTASSSVDSFPAKSDPRTLLLLSVLENRGAHSTEKPQEGDENVAADTNPLETGTAPKPLSVQCEKVDITKNLAAFRLNSMLGIDLRHCCFRI